MDMKIYQMLEYLNTRLSNIERSISNLEEQVNLGTELQKNLLLQQKNELKDVQKDLLNSTPYNDLSPELAYEIYNSGRELILLDVSKRTESRKIDGSIRIPLEELPRRYTEIATKKLPILVISEKGIRSIQACEMLVRKGFFNLNNISGGHDFWARSMNSEVLESL